MGGPLKKSSLGSVSLVTTLVGTEAFFKVTGCGAGSIRAFACRTPGWLGMSNVAPLTGFETGRTGVITGTGGEVAAGFWEDRGLAVNAGAGAFSIGTPAAGCS